MISIVNFLILTLKNKISIFCKILLKQIEIYIFKNNNNIKNYLFILHALRENDYIIYLNTNMIKYGNKNSQIYKLVNIPYNIKNHINFNIKYFSFFFILNNTINFNLFLKFINKYIYNNLSIKEIKLDINKFSITPSMLIANQNSFVKIISKDNFQVTNILLIENIITKHSTFDTMIEYLTINNYNPYYYQPFTRILTLSKNLNNINNMLFIKNYDNVKHNLILSD